MPYEAGGSGLPQSRMLFPVAFGAGLPRPLEVSTSPCVTSIANAARTVCRRVLSIDGGVLSIDIGLLSVPQI